jgi:hypothetical protein
MKVSTVSFKQLKTARATALEWRFDYLFCITRGPDPKGPGLFVAGLGMGGITSE